MQFLGKRLVSEDHWKKIHDHKLRDDEEFRFVKEKHNSILKKYKALVKNRTTLSSKKRDEMLTKIANLEEINEDISNKLHSTKKEMLESKVKAFDDI